MAIQRNAGGGGNVISENGEYHVKVTEIKTGLSKSGKQMLTVTFQTPDEKQIRGYYVGALAFHMKDLENLKLAAGLDVKAPAGQLVGRECGILVEMGAPDEVGRRFASIVGYGPVSELSNKSETGFAAGDDIPF